MEKYVIDIECDGLLREATKIHCLGYCNTKTGLVCSTSYQDQIKDFFLQEDVYFIAHNGIMYDFPVIEKLLGIEIKAKKIDTLALSWILSPERKKHGLGEYGEEFGIKKPKIEDWSNLKIEEYIHRVEEDVKINFRLWKQQGKALNELYEGNHEEIYRYLDYLSYKMGRLAEQQTTGIRLDIPLVEQSLAKLEVLKEEKIVKLREGMPKKAKKAIKFPPKIMFKADGSASSNRIKWLEFLKTNNLPETYNEEVEFIHTYEEPNPNSHDQIKDWLYSLGWIPENIKHVRDKKKNEVRKVPQIKSKDEEGEICNSIKKLFPLAPALEALDDLFVISHRITIFKGFLRDNVEGILYQELSGITNTNRIQHSILVNLPAITRAYAENVRGSLIAREDKLLLGADIVALEDMCKRHFIYQYDEEYVKAMDLPGYDPHLEIAVLGGFLTKEQAEEHKLYSKTEGREGKSYKEIRHICKTANYALTYKTGVETLSRTTGLSKKDAEKLKATYWKRNKSILQVEDSLRIKIINGQKWLLNPISKFWYSLRSDKDKFSTLNQGTGSYVFDRWLYYTRKQGLLLTCQFHDEQVIEINNNEQEESKIIVERAMEQVNEELKLNIKINCSVQTGLRYSEIH